MYSNGIIKKISIHNFRSHYNLIIDSNSCNIVLFGENGAGKTNILDAISMFSPGKGIRNSKHENMVNNNSKSKKFEIKILMKFNHGDLDFHKTFNADSGKPQINFFIDDEKVSSNNLLDYLRVIWVTPVMEKVMLQSHSEKRKFFDRIIFNINKDYLKNCRKLEKLLKERINLLDQYNSDGEWITIVEDKISDVSFDILEERKKKVELINKYLSKISEPFTSCVVQLSHKLQSVLFQLSKKEFKQKYSDILRKNRAIDKEISRTSLNINSVEFDIYKSKNLNLEAKDCSTGEQKSMLISIIISVCKIIKELNPNLTLIVLIDEAMAHFDEKHREKLFDELLQLNSQVWYTGVSKELFKSISEQTVFFEVKNNI
ncbi:MAG: AAA family ATPase [Pelagibacterales bacterium]|nr:AAA family ATPase [Pelagibacterales bacterium]